jgi:hypothetical protein
MLAEICTGGLSGSTALMSFIEFAKLARSARHVTSRRITSETYFGVTSDHVCYYERRIYTNLYPTYDSVVTWPFSGRAARARP